MAPDVGDDGAGSTHGRLVWLVALVAAVLLAPAPAAAASGEPRYRVDLPDSLAAGVPVPVTIEYLGLGRPGGGPLRLKVGQDRYDVQLAGGVGDATVVFPDAGTRARVQLLQDGAPVPFETFDDPGTGLTRASVPTIAGWLTILPPVVAIGVALVSRRVIPALVLGVWLGAWLTYGLTLPGAWLSLLDVLDRWTLEALADPDHVSIVLFTLMIGGMIGIVSRNGGTMGIVRHVTRWANKPRRAELATGGLGVAIFFDDYANSLIVGNAMRPVTDRLRISREKLAYIVDSTAAPVSSIALVSTWVGFEIGVIADAVGDLPGLDQSGYVVFLQSLPYRFYAVYAILLVFAIAWLRRDFGPMHAAERRAHDQGLVYREGANVGDAGPEADQLAAKEGVPERMSNALVPIVVLIGAALAGLFVTGSGETLTDIVGSADSYASLMWGSLLGVLTAALLSLGQRVLTLGETVEAWFAGLKSVLFVLIILTLAWALSSLTESLHSAEFLASTLGDTLPPAVVPALLFVVAAAVSLATGTSWGTMGILMPLTIPLTWAILDANGMAGPEGLPILYAAVGTVLTGAVWGDHCSPISDTTVLSSLACRCDHIDHVRTQLPYALFAGAVSIVVGLLPVGFGVPWWVTLPLGAVVMVAILRLVGRRNETAEELGVARERVAT